METDKIYEKQQQQQKKPEQNDENRFIYNL